MRFIGNKTKLIDEIDNFIKNNVTDSNKIFCDLFSGTGTVGNFYKDKFKIISNDNLYSSYVLTHAKTRTPDLKFKKLNFDPISILNDDSNLTKGFIFNNYSPEKTNRMYFSVFNSKRIDFIRLKIEEWFNEKKIDYDEYIYLIAMLLEAVSKVANVAGVYGSFLKTWDPRALKKISIEFLYLDTRTKSKKNTVYNKNVFDLIENINGDILYIDPPYTKNQYSVQYHILETIALYDNPELSGITGKRDTSNQTSIFSQQIKVNIAFNSLIRKAKFKHIIVSYSSLGLMSENYITSVLKRYGDKKTFKIKKIKYKRYLNNKTSKKGENNEYLFYIRKKKDNINIVSPLNYQGNKAGMINFIRDNLPKKIDTFVDVFAGGFNVGVNIKSRKVIYNDINTEVLKIIKMFYYDNTYDILRYIKKNIKKYDLTKNGKESYMKLRSDFNFKNKENRNVKMLYLLLLYGFQQQLRFNSKLEYNNPVGQSGFNENVLEKIISFSESIKKQKIIFETQDFELMEKYINTNNFFYFDPPYLITLGSYNDGKRGFNGWSEIDEKRLLSFIDKINKKGAKFMLSNVIFHKGKENTILNKWIKKNKYNVINFKEAGSSIKKRDEIIITNYKK